MFFALGPTAATISDANAELVETYRAIRDGVEEVIALLSCYPYERTFFDEIRKARPRLPKTRAARLIYLNKTAFNGLYRVNRDGGFNVPFGRYANPTVCQPERLRRASEALKGTEVICGNFSDIVDEAGEGDVVYLDPPYITGHSNNGFHKYNARLFSWADQKRLSTVARDLKERGVRVVVSNANHADIRDLYPDFLLYTVTRRNTISGTTEARGLISEALFTSHPILPKLDSNHG